MSLLRQFHPLRVLFESFNKINLTQSDNELVFNNSLFKKEIKRVIDEKKQ
jgi:hypothetical protein